MDGGRTGKGDDCGERAGDGKEKEGMVGRGWVERMVGQVRRGDGRAGESMGRGQESGGAVHWRNWRG